MYVPVDVVENSPPDEVVESRIWVDPVAFISVLSFDLSRNSSEYAIGRFGLDICGVLVMTGYGSVILKYWVVDIQSTPF